MIKIDSVLDSNGKVVISRAQLLIADINIDLDVPLSKKNE